VGRSLDVGALSGEVNEPVRHAHAGAPADLFAAQLQPVVGQRRDFRLLVFSPDRRVASMAELTADNTAYIDININFNIDVNV
jgi:hypothetical protein